MLCSAITDNRIKLRVCGCLSWSSSCAQLWSRLKKKIITGDESWCLAYEGSVKWLGPKLPKCEETLLPKILSEVSVWRFFCLPTVNAAYYRGVMNWLLKWTARGHLDLHTNENCFLLCNNTSVICSSLIKKSNYGTIHLY